MLKKFCIVLSALFILPTLALADITYSGSSTIGTGILKAGAADAFANKTGKKLASIEIPGSGKGVKALIEGKVMVAGASRPLKPEEKKEKLSSTTIGYDAVTVFVHKNNPIKNLSKEQLKGIFTGKIKNWKEVGGKNAPIVPNTEILDASGPPSKCSRSTSWMAPPTPSSNRSTFPAIRSLKWQRMKMASAASASASMPPFQGTSRER
ncbi:substrate-binding domain-containing protein [Geotalea toluenoxydans]|uniref:substrate-binding domain-containing protein n=1 Tax=Geotalea toluenoxydans TaxID=421624 RepID=UPI0006D094D4|nr:substrate-binding domain-containing protein [Geotalea toluenoxydans]